MPRLLKRGLWAHTKQPKLGPYRIFHPCVPDNYYAQDLLDQVFGNSIKIYEGEWTNDQISTQVDRLGLSEMRPTYWWNPSIVYRDGVRLLGQAEYELQILEVVVLVSAAASEYQAGYLCCKPYKDEL